MYRECYKRMLDVIISLLAIILLLPVYLVLYFKIKKELGSPVLFTQDRPGLHGKIFKMYKFRSMTDERDENGELLPDDQRLTAFGKKLRSTSLDELPELFNVLKGDMSLVGPRPLLVQYLPLYNKRQRHRHDVRPGITGLAQVKGRNSITWDEKFEWDIRYVKQVSLWMDIKILMWTVITVLRRDGINQSAEVTMEPFKGSPEPESRGQKHRAHRHGNTQKKEPSSRRDRSWSVKSQGRGWNRKRKSCKIN